MPFDLAPHSRCLLQKLAAMSHVVDAPNSLTYVPDLIRALDALIMRQRTGLYHVVNPGVASPLEIARRLRTGGDEQPIAITPVELDERTTARRSHCRLRCDRLAAEGLTMSPVHEALAAAIAAARPLTALPTADQR